MSIKIRSQVEELTKLGHSKPILSQLANSSSDCGHCFPSISTIAHRAGCSTRTVNRHLKFLEQRNYIRRVARVRSNGSKSTNDYYLNLPLIEKEYYETKVPVENPSENPYLRDATPCQVSNDGMRHDVATRMRHDDATINDHNNDHINPIVPSKGQDKKIESPKTKQPFEREYRFTPKEEEQIVEKWKSVSQGKFIGIRLISDSHRKAIAKTYQLYKSYHKAGIFSSELKTKFEWVMTLIDAFDEWVANSPNPDFYKKTPNSTWTADFDYMLRKSTFDKVISTGE